MRKKLLSLLLAALMILGLLPAAALAADGETAAEPNIVLSVYDAEGTELSAGSKIETGDTIKVRLKTTAELKISNMQAFIAYDSDVLQFNASENAIPTDFQSRFSMTDVNDGAVRSTDVDTSGLTEGTPIVLCQYIQALKILTIEANTVWAEVSFTARKAADTTELKLAINEATVLGGGESKLDPIDIRSSFTPKGTSLSVEVKQIPATGITLNSTATKITRGKTTTLKATVTPTDTTDKITWESDNEEIATVDGNGKVTGIAVGTANITARAGEQSATCEVTVEWIPVESVTLDQTEYTIVRGKTANITTTILPADASDKNKVYHSADETVATVAYGQIKAVGVGTTEITVTVDGEVARATVTVTEIPITSARFTQDSYNVSVTKGAGSEFSLAVEPVDQTDSPDFQWTVEDPTILSLTVGTNKLKPTLKGLKLGTTTVTMKIRDIEISCQVTVNNPVSKVTVKGDANRMLIGGTTQLTATATHVSTAFEFTDTELTWSSSAPGVASVDQNGLVTALSTGMTYIYATANNGVTNNNGYAITVVSQADGSYTVTMPENETVVPGGKVTLPVSITSDTEGVNNYSAYHMVFTYDPNALELTTTEIPGCTLVTKTAGRIEVIRYGAVQNLGKAFDLTFNVKNVPGDTNVVLTLALVDISQNALASDAPAANVPKDTTTYKVSVCYDVTLPDGTNADSTKVEHGNDFTFRVTDYDPYKDYTFTASYGETTADVTDNGDGNFTVKNVTGNLTITMNVKGKTFTVTLNPEEAEGADMATYGENYTFTVKKADGKEYNYDVWASINGTNYKPTGPDENGKYTIPGAEIKGNITITVDKTIVPKEGYVAVKVEGTGKADVTAAETAKKNADFTFTVTKVAGYAYTAEISVGTETIKEGSEFLTYVDSAEGIRTYTLKGEKVTNTLLITVGKVLEHKVNVTVSDRYEIKAIWEPTALDGENYTFTVTGFKAVYDLRATVTENGETKEIAIDRADLGNSTRSTVTCTVKNVKGDLDIRLSFIANQDYVAVKVSKFVELDGKTAFLVATRTKPGFARGFMLDTYDGYAMYQEQNLYKDKFETTKVGGVMTNVWLVIVSEGETFTVDDALAKLTYTNRRRTDNFNVSLPLPVGSASSTDVNGSGKVDVNDAQLVYDIYNGVYPTFCKTNRTGSTYVEPQIGATMTKFLCADVNKDMKVDSTDAAALVALIK